MSALLTRALDPGGIVLEPAASNGDGIVRGAL
jgi:hypothetical protein